MKRRIHTITEVDLLVACDHAKDAGLGCKKPSKERWCCLTRHFPQRLRLTMTRQLPCDLRFIEIFRAGRPTLLDRVHAYEVETIKHVFKFLNVLTPSALYCIQHNYDKPSFGLASTNSE